MKKIFTAYLLLNWKNNDIRLLKRKPEHINPYEIPISLKLTVSIPKKKELKATGSITLSEEKIEDMVIEEL